MAIRLVDWHALDRAIDGSVVLPESAQYDWVRKPFIARFDDIRPAAVVLCKAPHDVAAALEFARVASLEVAPRSGGHCFAGFSSTSGLVLDVSPMADVTVDSDVAFVGAGLRIGALYDSLLPHGATIPSGSCPSVGIGGTTLGGGLGVLGRRYGLTSDHVVAAEVVLADGRIVQVDESHDADLFWALRGAGGGNFGVVTQFTFRLRPAPRMTNFYFVWDFRHAAAVVGAWQRTAPEMADEMAAGLALTATDNIEEAPFVEVYGAMLGNASDTGQLLGDLVARVGDEPATTSLRELSYHETAMFQAGLLSAANTVVETPEGPVARQGYRFTKSEFFEQPLSADAVARLVAVFPAGRVPGEYRGLEFVPWRGAYCRVDPAATAFVHRSALFSLKHAVLVPPDTSAEAKAAAHRWVTSSWAAAHPCGSGYVYPNFPDPDLTGWADAYYGTNYDRLRRVKARYDPDQVFRFQQSIEPG